MTSPDLLVLGSGVAGLSAALRADAVGLRAFVVTKGELPQSATWYAQGGVAAALESPDSPELHFADTISAGAGLCDEEAVRVLVTEGPRRVLELMDLGAEFDRSGDTIALTREGGHSLARVLHAGGDATGAEIERTLVAAVRARPIGVIERGFTTTLLIEGGRCVGARVRTQDGAVRDIRARHTLLATGGAGQLFAVTTNPTLSTGDGIAMAHRIGAAIADVEFMQFHPTALHHPAMPRPLLSEALRGEGAVLRDRDGVAFMSGEHELADLAPRDVVAREITKRLRDQGVEHLWLDASAIDDFPTRFPTIWGACTGIGLDPSTDWLPVAPAAHYISGGVMADLDGATTVAGLWACGEAACCGVHGANRLASNSLLDGLVFGPRAVEAIAAGKDGPDATGVLRTVLAQWSNRVRPALETGVAGRSDPAAIGEKLQRVMTRHAGVLRDAHSLEVASKYLADLVGEVDSVPDTPLGYEVRNLIDVARLLVDAATAREESRGTHTRLDHPGVRDEYCGRLVAGGDGQTQLIALTGTTND